MTYTYDFTDRIARAANSHTNLTLLRDRHGRLVSERINDREVAYGYDEFGRLTGRTTPAGAESVWDFDSVGQPRRLTADGRAVTLEYDRVGRETGRRFGESLSVTRSFDAMNRLISQAVDHSRGRIQSRTYEYRADGSLTKVHDQLNGVRRYELDLAGRTTRVSGEGWAESYAYDALGNQTAADWPARPFGDDGCGERAYQGANLVRAGRIRYEHDAAGRVVLRQKTRSPASRTPGGTAGTRRTGSPRSSLPTARCGGTSTTPWAGAPASSASRRTASTYWNRWTSPGTVSHCASRPPGGGSRVTR
jgi:YD repeat-containing protein